MPTHPFSAPRGRVTRLTVRSDALAGNLLGDPAEREVALYLPQGYEASDTDYPLLVGLAGFTGSGFKMLSWRSFDENLPQRLDRLVAEDRMGPVILALPDAFTSLGGNQYVDSAATGQWERWLAEDVIPAIEEGFRVRKGAAHRAVFGKSSGGYGALVQGLRHGQCWAALACHSGDVGFDLVYRRDFPMLLDQLARHDGSITAYVEQLRDARKIRGQEMHALMLLAMAASYDPDPQAPLGIRLPVDTRTCELIDERWQRWLAHDPLKMVRREECRESLRRLKGIFIDCGSHDQYALHYGNRALVRELEAAGIEHRYEEFDDNHSGIDYRLDESLPFLFAAIDS
jgi:enterochelin esterase-like enzyme